MGETLESIAASLRDFVRAEGQRVVLPPSSQVAPGAMGQSQVGQPLGLPLSRRKIAGHYEACLNGLRDGECVALDQVICELERLLTEP